jgi:prephenate dehydrogenase
MTTQLSEILSAVTKEVLRAQAIHHPMHGPHEALGVILEEFEEYKDEVWAYNPAKNRDTRPRQKEELIQLAAMAIRAILETTSSEEPRAEKERPIQTTMLPPKGRLLHRVLEEI